MAATLRIGAILMTIAAHYLSVNADSIEFDCFEEGTLRPEYRITRVLTSSRPERRYALAVPCDGRGDRAIWISKEFNSNVNIPSNSDLVSKGAVIVQRGSSHRFPSVVNASVLLEDTITQSRVFEEVGAGATPTKRFVLEIQDAVALESKNSPMHWTSQTFCASTKELIASGAVAIAGLIVVAVVLILVTWRCTKCLGKSSSKDLDAELDTIRAELGNGK